MVASPDFKSGAYVISRKDFKYRNVLSFFFYFTTLFNGIALYQSFQ